MAVGECKDTVCPQRHCLRAIAPQQQQLHSALKPPAPTNHARTGCVPNRTCSSLSSADSPRLPMKSVLQGGLSRVLDTGA